MQVTTKLNDMFLYSIWPIIIILIILILGFVLYFKKPKKKKLANIVLPVKKNIMDIKNKYLNKIEILINDLNNKTISDRIAYQRLSCLIRNFIYEATDIKVQNYTLSEIEKANIPILYELVKEYYDPEFAINSFGNILSSIMKTKEVILKWN